MEQSKFILEVQARQCIWNPRVGSYLDRVLKRQAWEEIAAIMYDGFNSCSENEQREKVIELQKKWKSLKDYYKRRNRNGDIDEKTKKKKPIVELLQFLDKDTKFDHEIRKQQRPTDRIKKIKNKNLIFQLPDYKITVQKFNDNKPSKPRKPKKKSLWCPKPGLETNSLQDEEMKFLQSLLPVMQSLTDRERFEFKLEVMMLIKKIKYDDIEVSASNADRADQGNNFLNNESAALESEPRRVASMN